MEKHKPIKYYLSLISILLIPLIIIIYYSYADELNIGDFVLQQIDIRSHFIKQGADGTEMSYAVVDTLESDSLALDSLLLSAVDSILVDTTAQRILFFGDSMVEGLSKRMRRYAAENGHELLNVIWYSSSTKIWAQNDTLDYYIREFQPTYVMACLGGNELFIRDIDKRDNYIKTIIEKVGEIPFLWIGPPNWKEDTGINRLIRDNMGFGRFFPSKRLTYERGKDGAHPTVASSAKWMDSIAVWMADSAAYRIRMNFPVNNERHGKTILLQPLK